MLNVLTFIGTRPEAIKLAPVIHALQTRDGIRSAVCVTGQHRELLRQMLNFFSIRADADLDIMRRDQTLSATTAEILRQTDQVFDDFAPDWVIVQGDTTTAMAVSLSAFYRDIKVAHVEAGLRTGNMRAPFPEELNRRIAGLVAHRHFAPTAGAQAALLREGVSPSSVLITGNTGIDALHWALHSVRQSEPPIDSALLKALEGRRLVLATTHRRENIGAGIEEVCAALSQLTATFDDLAVVLPIHPNPNVRATIETLLSDAPDILLVPPLDYSHFVWLLDRAVVVLTDSGGVQEEAASLGKPIGVLRDVTERPEAIQAGNAQLTGADRTRIVEFASAILSNPTLREQMPRSTTVFGDGHAAERIVESLVSG